MQTLLEIFFFFKFNTLLQKKQWSTKAKDYNYYYYERQRLINFLVI